jgi:hypothetical protein
MRMTFLSPMAERSAGSFLTCLFTGRPDRHVKLQDSNRGLSLMGLMSRLAQTPPTSTSRYFPGDIDIKKALELVITHDNFPNITYINITLGTSLSGLQGRARKFGGEISTLEFLTIAISATVNLAPTLKSFYLLAEVNEVLLHFLTLLVEKMTTIPPLVNLFLNLQCNKGVHAGALQRLPLLSSCFVNRFTTSLGILDLRLNPSVANIAQWAQFFSGLEEFSHLEQITVQASYDAIYPSTLGPPHSHFGSFIYKHRRTLKVLKISFFFLEYRYRYR